MYTELRPAYEWTCDECGIDNFEKCVVADFNQEDRLQVARELGLIDDIMEDVPDCLTEMFVTYPDYVTCKNCNSEFKTKSFNDNNTSG